MSPSKRARDAKVPLWRWIALFLAASVPTTVLVLKMSSEHAAKEADSAAASQSSAKTNPSVPSPPAGEVVVSTGRAPVTGLVLGGDRVYFAEAILGQTEQHVFATPAAGGAEVTLGSVRFPLALALGKDALAVADNGGIMTDAKGTVTVLPLDGSPARVVASKLVLPTSIAVDATHVYWIDGGSVERDYVDGVVGRAPLAGGSSTVLAAGEREPNGIAVDATHVYWARHQKGGLGEVVRMPLEGGKVELVSPGQSRVKRVTVVGAEVYWVSSTDLSDAGAVIRKANTAGGPAVDVVRSAHRICSFATDGVFVYWSEPGEASEPPAGRILKLRSSGQGEPVVLAQGLDRPCYLALDETHVYFTTQSKERVKKTPKNASGSR